MREILVVFAIMIPIGLCVYGFWNEKPKPIRISQETWPRTDKVVCE